MASRPCLDPKSTLFMKIEAGERPKLRYRYYDWQDSVDVGGRDELFGFVAETQPLHRRKRSSSVDRALDSRIVSEDVVGVWFLPRRAMQWDFSQFRTTRRYVSPPSVTKPNPAELKRVAEARRRVQQAEEDRARTLTKKRAAAQAAKEYEDLRLKIVEAKLEAKRQSDAVKAAKSAATKAAADLKRLEKAREEERIIEEGLAERRRLMLCIFCKGGGGVLACPTCDAQICQGCVDKGGLETRTMWRGCLHRMPFEDEFRLFDNCPRCCWPQETDKFDDELLERLTEVDMSQGLALRMEKLAKGYFYIQEECLGRNSASMERAKKLCEQFAGTGEVRFRSFIGEQIESICWNWTSAGDFFEEVDRFLAVATDPTDDDSHPASEHVISALVETHRRTLLVRRILDDFCNRNELRFKITIHDMACLPTPMGIRFKINVDALKFKNMQGPFALFCAVTGIEISDELEELINFPSAAEFKKSRSHPLEGSLATHVASRVPRWHFMSMLDRAFRLLASGTFMTVEEFDEWVRTEVPVVKFKGQIPRWEVLRRFRNKLIPLITARGLLNAVQANPPIVITGVSHPDHARRVHVGYVLSDVLPENKTSVEAVMRFVKVF